MNASIGIPLPRAFKLELFPIDRLDPGGDLIDFLSKILVTSYDEAVFDTGGSFTVGLTVAEELVIDLVGLNGFALVIGGASVTSLTLGVEMRPNSLLVKLGGGARLRFPRNLLKPVMLSGTDWVDDPSRPYAEIEIHAGVVVDKDWNVTFDGTTDFILEPAMVADSGFVIEGDVALDFSETTGLEESVDYGLPPSWRGVILRKPSQVHLPPSITDTVPIDSLEFENFHIGSGGVSGRIRPKGPLGAGVLAGFPFTATAFEVELRQNAIIGIQLTGSLTLPFFDSAIAVEAGFDLQGNLIVGLQSADGSGLATLNSGPLSMTLESLSFEQQAGLFSVVLSGKIKLDAFELDWPTVGVEALVIDSTGAVRIEGGWIDLREQYVLDLRGFQLSISRIGFGTETDSRRWIGFNGGLKLVDGLTAGASVEGMRVIWDPSSPNDPTFSLEGVGVELDMPGNLSFRGFVALREHDGGFRFDGCIALELTTLDLSIDGQLVVGYNGDKDFTYFAIYMGVELPLALPLGSTGLGLYGLAGLFALNMEPDRKPAEAWYEIPPASDWYHRDPPGVAELRKWRDADSSLALSAGVTIGTVVDNGFTFAGKLLLAIVFPGPIILLEGRANVLKQRADLGEEGMFRTLLVVDGRERTMTAGLDANYHIADGGELFSMHGSLEVFFDFDDQQAWHLYLGIDEPRERRIGADIFFRLFHTESYFMVDAHRVHAGAWAGIDKHWTFGPMGVDLAAWLDGKADLSFKPAYFQGVMSIHGGFAVSLFGHGYHLGASSDMSAGVFDPFYIKADFKVSVGMPWPMPDFDVDFSIEWGPEFEPPLLPVPVREVSLGHELATVTWVLPAGTLLLPATDDALLARGFFKDQLPALGDPDMPPPPVNKIPVVPLDARPEITFGRSVHDDAKVGDNEQPQYVLASPPGLVRIGDPAKNEGPVLIRPSLKALHLDRWSGAAWIDIAQAGQTVDPSIRSKLYGTWMPVPGEPGTVGPGQTKLRIWAKTPFSYTRRSSANWTDTFLNAYPNYPCIDIPKDRKICCDFSGCMEGERLTPPWSCPKNDLFVITWPPPLGALVSARMPVGKSGHHQTVNRLCFPPGGQAIVIASRELNTISVEASSTLIERDDESSCVDFTGRVKGIVPNPTTEHGLRFKVLEPDGSAAVESKIASIVMSDMTEVTGLACGAQLLCELAKPVIAVRLTISSSMPRATIAAFDEEDDLVGKESVGNRTGLVEMQFASADKPIVKVLIIAVERSTTLLHRICPVIAVECEVTVDAYDRAGQQLSRTQLQDGSAEIDGRGASQFVISAGHCGLCLTSVCAQEGPSASYKEELKRINTHIVEELARWSADDETLLPHTTFRLRIKTVVDVQIPAGSKAPANFAGEREITQVAYFRTEGPPGLTALTRSGDGLVPGVGGGEAIDPPAIETGLEDLRRYVSQTVPATIAPEGQAPTLTRPVYRGYDVGVQFKNNYVDLMYARSGCDLSLMLYDMNNQPVRDAHGRLVVQPNRWGRTDTLTLSDSEQRWLELVGGARCTSSQIDLGKVARNKVTTVSGFVLDPNTIYEARLIPLLIRESFDSQDFGAFASGTGATLLGNGAFTWRVLDVGESGAISKWQIGESGDPKDRYVEQSSSISLGVVARNEVFPGGTFLLLADMAQRVADDPGQPSRWTDYRVCAVLSSSTDGLIGMGMRMSDHTGYLFTLDSRANRRRLIQLSPKTANVLAEASGGYDLNASMTLTFEAVGSRLRVYLDGEPMFDVHHSALSMGTIGLYTADNSGTRITEIRVDDLRATASVVYNFKFTTSAFADFYHHLQSSSEYAPSLPLTDPGPVAAAAAVAVKLTGSEAGVVALEAESRGYDTVALAALGALAHQRVDRLEFARLTKDGQTTALLVRTAEPIDWTRARLTVCAATDTIPAPVPASVAKLSGLSFASKIAPDPLDETATVLLIEDRDLTGYAIERRTLPSPDASQMADGTPLWLGDLIASHEIGDDAPASIWKPEFVSLTELNLVVSEGMGVPNWQATAGVLSQDALFLTPDATLPGYPNESSSYGTLAIGPPLAEGDVRVTAHLELTNGGSAGIVFRYTDSQNYYRFAIDRQRGRRILSKLDHGVFSVLSTTGLAPGVADYDVVIKAVGSRMVVVVNGTLVTSVLDSTHIIGAVGFYTQRQPHARFEAVTVERISRRLGDWRIDDLPTDDEPGRWKIAHGVLVKTPQPASVDGQTFAVIADVSWSDLQLNTVLIPQFPASGKTGLVWRYASAKDHFRFVLDASGATASVVARSSSVDQVLWSGALPTGGLVRARQVSIKAIGCRLILTVDEKLLADIADAGLGAGMIGAFADLAAGLEVCPPDVRHAAPAFEPWHVFAAENRRVSGRRVCIASGVKPSDYVSPAGEDARWRDQAVAGFKPSFPSEGVDVRLIDPTGKLLHQRRFRPSAAYSSLEALMVRAADGTGLVLLPAEPGFLPVGELAIEWVFRRDNSAVDPAALTLRQEGETENEIVILRIV